MHLSSVLLLFVVAATLCAAQAARPCPAILREVCGKDGRTYPNRCVAESRNVQVCIAEHNNSIVSENDYKI